MAKLRVIHVTDSAGGVDHLWGKENVIVSLMNAQRDSGLIEPELITFSAGMLDNTIGAAGFRAYSLEKEHHRFPAIRALKKFQAILADGPIPIVHTHEYKANMVARVLRASHVPMRKLISTCHGWVERSPQLDIYCELDRLTAFGSDIVTVTDPWMISRFPSLFSKNIIFIPNGVISKPVPTDNERLVAKNSFGFPSYATVIGSLGRLSKNKGIRDILTAAERTQGKDIIWAIAGSGALQNEIEHCGLSNVCFVGYQTDNIKYLAALDVYLQASYYEGLSLSLLEAMRAGLPIISTKAGATELAISDGYQALMVEAGNIEQIVTAAYRLHIGNDLRWMLGTSARMKFNKSFSIEQQHKAFLKLYLSNENFND